MKYILLLISFICMFSAMTAASVAAQETPPFKELAEGVYTIKNKANMYLSHAEGTLATSKTNANNLWVVAKARGSAYYLYPENSCPSIVLNLDNDWDIEGNTTGLHIRNVYETAQSWLLTPDNDGTYKIQTKRGSDRILTGNGAQKPTINTDTSADTQRWTFTRIGDATIDNARNAKQLLEAVNGILPENTVIHTAEGKTGAQLKALIRANKSKENMIEGKYIVLHLPNGVWDMYNDPKKLIDMYDFVCAAQAELAGGKIEVSPYKLVFLTNYATEVYMYSSGIYCVFSVAGAKDAAADWKATGETRLQWGIGHEIGHSMVNSGLGRLFEGHDMEAWCNIFNMYGFYKQGEHEFAREFVSVFFSDYSDADKLNGRIKGIDYDKLPRDLRKAELLERSTQLFVKLPVLLIDYYGWDGMRKFFTQAESDYSSGMVRSDKLQDRVDYMVVQLSKAYGMNLSVLFDYWDLPASEAAKKEIATLPKEVLISKVYKLK